MGWKILKFTNRFKREKKDEPYDYLTMNWKEKAKLILLSALKWGGIILLPNLVILIVWDYVSYVNDGSGIQGTIYFALVLMAVPGAIMIIGGCMGGLSRYNVPPKLRIVEPDDQAVTPSSFQIRIRYDPKVINPESIEVLVNEKVIPSQLNLENDTVVVPRVFKTPPKRAVSLALETHAKDLEDKEIKDKIRIICDPDSDEEDYLEYWEFKREDDTYWGKEMLAAARHAKRNVNALKMIVISLFLLALNYIVSAIYLAVRYR
jgi:hypothetical protein